MVKGAKKNVINKAVKAAKSINKTVQNLRQTKTPKKSSLLSNVGGTVGSWLLPGFGGEVGK